jgi:hypothetical protein
VANPNTKNSGKVQPVALWVKRLGARKSRCLPLEAQREDSHWFGEI